MNFFRLSNVHLFLKTLETHPKKRLSQNFLIDQNILNKILLAADIKEDDLVLEIGPGLGAMTELLLRKKARVIAIEKDSSFIPHLQKLDCPTFTLLEGDALTFPLKEELYKQKRPHEKVKLIANIPYHLTTPLLQRFLPENTLFSQIFFLMQKEVAKRCVAHEGNKEYGALSLFIRYYSTPSFLFNVSPHSFYPVPKVISSFVQFNLEKKVENDLLSSSFFFLTRSSFEQRRKMLHTSLKRFFHEKDLENAFALLKLKKTIRPEELSLTDFMGLAKLLPSPHQKD